MKTICKRLLSLLMCLCLIAGNMPAVMAEQIQTQQGGSFALAVLTADGVVIEPTYVEYAAGQTIAQALLSSPYEFVGLLDDPQTSGWIEEIESVSASYSLFYDRNGDALTELAEGISALCITEKVDHYSEEYLKLIRTMARYNDSDNGVHSYDAAQNAYENSLTDLYTAAPDHAAELDAALEKTMEEYEKYVSGETVVLTLDIPGVCGGTLYDSFGNTYPVSEETRYALPPGAYRFDLHDGGRSHIRGSVELQEDMTLRSELPDGQWLDQIDVSIVPDNDVTGTVWEAVEKLDEWTFAVPDYAEASLYPYLVPEEGIDTAACGIYLGDGAKRVWRSHRVALADVIEESSMQGAEFTLEARQEYQGFEQYQTYPVTIVRVPSLSALTVYSEGTRLPLAFSPEEKEYTLSAAGDSVDLFPETLTTQGISVCVNGAPLEGQSCNVPLETGTTEIEITVTHENGLSSSYQLSVEKQDSVEVTVQSNAELVQVYNEAGAEIAQTGGGYALIPGETYTYVTTTQEYFHTSGQFTASEGLCVRTAEPIVEDGLEKLVIKPTFSASSLPYEADNTFAPGLHEYVYQVGSNETGFCVEAQISELLSSEGYTVTAQYAAWDTGAEQNMTFSSGKRACMKFVGVSGIPNTMRLRVQKQADGVTFYQDYVLTAQRKLQLNDMSVSCNGETLILNQSETGKTGFSKFITGYTAQVGQTVPQIDLNLRLFSTAAGMDRDVVVKISCGDSSQTLNYSTLEVDETQTVTLALDEAMAEQSLEITLERENAVSQTYTVTLEKLPAIETVFRVEPGEALVYLTDDLTGLRVPAQDDGKYLLSTGKAYHYVVTKYGYKAKSASFVAGEANSTLSVVLEEAEKNDRIDILLDTDYPSFRGNENNNGVTFAPTPITAENAVLNWATKIGDGMKNGGVGSPIIVGGSLYSYAGSSVFRLDKDTGEVLASAVMDHASSFSITPPAYGEGLIFIALANGGIQAFHAQTLESVWVYRDPLGGQPNCPLVYKDGYLYTGFWNAEEKKANFVCVSTTDEDTNQGKEEKLASWSYTHNGFYWAGAYVSDEYLLVTTDDGSNGYTSASGSLLSIDTRTGLLLDELVMPNVGDLRSSVCYDEATDAYYFTSKGGDFYCVKVEADGTIRRDSLKRLHLDNGANSEKNPPMSTSTPVVYNGRAYIGVSGTGQFVSYSGHNITVIDLNNWKIAYTVPTQGYPQTSGLLTTAYEDDREYVYVYFLDNYTPGKLRVIRDTAGQNSFDTGFSTSETYTKSGKTYTVNAGYVLFTPSGEHAQYAICSPIVDEYGNLFFKNDSGYLMCVGSTITELVIEEQPDKLIYEEGQCFDPTGLRVTAVYSNGIRRDMSEYAVASTEPLTVDDREMTVSLDLGQHQVMYQNRDGEAGVQYHIPTATIDLSIQTDHSWDSGKVIRESSVLSEGEKLFVCTICSEQRSEIIPKEQPCDGIDCEGSGFVDWVITEHWAHDAMDYVVSRGLMNGVSGDSFDPNGELTRGMLVTILWRYAGAEDVGQSSFTDVPEDAWYAKSIAWAEKYGIVSGVGEGRFGPDMKVTREQIATILFRYAGSLNLDTSARGDFAAFADGETVSFWAVDAMKWATASGILTGSADNGKLWLNPVNSATRAQASKLLMGYIELVLKNH